jgi:septum formation protein
MRTFILASGSPRRKELLEQIGLKFTVDPADTREDIDFSLEPHELARKLSLEKAQAVAARHKNAIVIGADTFGVFEGKIIGKPHSETEAAEMLQTLNGKPHQVITGFSIVDTAGGKTVSRSVKTTVYLRKLTAEEIDAYVKTKEPLDKAGAYAIQGLGALLVEKIEGDYFNVVGLPLSELAEALKEFEIKVL